MDERIMVKLTASGEFILFQTITRNKKRSRQFYIYADNLLSLRTHGFYIARDTSFAVFQADEEHDEFFFREYRGDQAGICGGLILHGQDNMDKAYYSVHT